MRVSLLSIWKNAAVESFAPDMPHGANIGAVGAAFHAPAGRRHFTARAVARLRHRTDQIKGVRLSPDEAMLAGLYPMAAVRVRLVADDFHRRDAIVPSVPGI